MKWYVIELGNAQQCACRASDSEPPMIRRAAGSGHPSTVSDWLLGRKKSAVFALLACWRWTHPYAAELVHRHVLVLHTMT
jgi:hypothetical protein